MGYACMVAVAIATGALALQTGAPGMATGAFAIAAIAFVLEALGRRAVHGVAALSDGLRGLLAPGERVLEEVAAAGPAVVAATDRRLLVADRSGTVLDAPYARIRRFDVRRRPLGGSGDLTITVDGAGHTIERMAPAGMLSVAQALLVRGVAGDTGAVHAWDARIADAPEAGERETGASRGLWTLVLVAACALHLNPFGIGIGAEHGVLPALPIVFVAACVCGYLVGTRHAFACLAPLNLLVLPAFFYATVTDARLFSLVLNIVAVSGLGIGLAVRRVVRGAARSGGPASAGRLIRTARRTLAVSGVLLAIGSAFGFDPVVVTLAVDQATRPQLEPDGRSNLSSGAASITYTPADGLHEFVTDESWSDDPGDGARWELRSSFTGGQNVVSLASYVFTPRLDDPDAVAAFVAGKDREHEDIAGHPVEHSEVRVDGRRGYVWEHDNDVGYWHHAVWFPAPRYSVRLECIAKKQVDRFERLCDEAMGSVAFPAR